MDLYSSGEELIKTRKPYTITKQRERWTEDEHNRFIEALKLYGRAWQRIEEHIGTKTAVQIRSHAQKFFTKLEKEALAKGVPVRQAIDIEIPPPRPKRKPSNPYPRKVGLKIPPQVAEKDGKQATSVSSSQFGTHLEKEPHLEKNAEKMQVKPGENGKTDDDVQICSEGISLSQEALCASVSSANGVLISRPLNNINSCNFREIVPPPPPTLEEVTDHDETNESYMTVETKEEHGNLDQHTSIFGKHENMIEPGNCSSIEQTHNYYPRHVPVHIVHGMSAKKSVSVQESTPPSQTGEVINIAAAAAAAASTFPCNNATAPAFHPLFVPFQEDHRSSSSSSSSLSSSFSNLVVSSLLQNPAAAHAAATSAAAATFWHSSANMEAASSRALFSSGMAAIAAATVAAATAWWAAHGLLPPPFALFTTATTDNNNQATASEKTNDAQHQSSEALPKKHPPKSEDRRKLDDPKEETAEHHDDSCRTKVPKPFDPSSCGSNTTSSSEIETDALEKKQGGQDKEETKVNLPCNDSTFRWSRGSLSPNESWKEVSEEGRLAFEALFSREVLPQSFSPPYDEDIKEQQSKMKNNEGASLNSRSCWPGPCQRNGEEGLGNMKLKVHHTGFKPYKRCSVEAKEINKLGCQNDEKLPKRMRLEGQAPST